MTGRPLLSAEEVVALRRPAVRLASPRLDRPQDLQRETERLGPRVVPTATAFLTGAECPFRCVYCDLWRYTLPEATPEGSIATQIEWTMEQLRCPGGPPAVHTLKLYNASNFFDERAVPSMDDDAILEALTGLERVVVECHPRLLLGRRGAERAQRYVDELSGLEIAFGLETTAPAGLEQIGKSATLAHFERAFEAAHQMGATTRAFVLHGIPREVEDEQDADCQKSWTLETVRWARDAGASAVSVIPVRGGNGAMERLAERGLWRRPNLAELLTVAEAAMEFESPGFDVFVDCWDLETFARDGHAEDAQRIERIRALDRNGRAAVASRSTDQGIAGSGARV